MTQTLRDAEGLYVYRGRLPEHSQLVMTGNLNLGGEGKPFGQNRIGKDPGTQYRGIVSREHAQMPMGLSVSARNVSLCPKGLSALLQTWSWADSLRIKAFVPGGIFPFPFFSPI